MIISSIELENVGPFKERTVIPCSAITLLFGENGAGKSAIIRSLLLLKQSLSIDERSQGIFRLDGPHANFGNANSLFFGRDPKAPGHIGIHMYIGGECQVPWDPSDDELMGVSDAFTQDDADDYHGQRYTFGLSPEGETGELELLRLTQYLGKEQERLLDLLPDNNNPFNSAGNPRRRGERSMRLDFGSLNRENSTLARDARAIQALIPEFVSEIKSVLAERAALPQGSGSDEDLTLGEWHEKALNNTIWKLTEVYGTDFWEAFIEHLEGYSLEQLVRDVQGHSAATVDLRTFLAAGAGVLSAVDLTSEVQDLQPERPIEWSTDDEFRINRRTGVAKFPDIFGPIASDHPNRFRILRYLLGCIGGYRQALVPDLNKMVIATSARVEDTLRGLANIGPSRQLPSRVVTRQEVRGSDFAASMGTLLDKDSALLAEVNGYAKRLGLGYTLSIQEVNAGGLEDAWIITVHDEKTGIDGTLQDVGYGVSQVLPVITAALANNDALVVVQQPELHLHPRLQSRIADVFVAGLAFHDNQFLIETHSEHIVYRLQRWIRDKALDPSMVAINWIYRDKDGSHCYPLRLDEEGDFIDEWPGGFFEDGFDDVIAGIKGVDDAG